MRAGGIGARASRRRSASCTASRPHRGRARRRPRPSPRAQSRRRRGGAPAALRRRPAVAGRVQLAPRSPAGWPRRRSIPGRGGRTPERLWCPPGRAASRRSAAGRPARRSRRAPSTAAAGRTAPSARRVRSSSPSEERSIERVRRVICPDVAEKIKRRAAVVNDRARLSRARRRQCGRRRGVVGWRQGAAARARRATAPPPRRLGARRRANSAASRRRVAGASLRARRSVRRAVGEAAHRACARIRSPSPSANSASEPRGSSYDPRRQVASDGHLATCLRVIRPVAAAPRANLSRDSRAAETALGLLGGSHVVARMWCDGKAASPPRASASAFARFCSGGRRIPRSSQDAPRFRIQGGQLAGAGGQARRRALISIVVWVSRPVDAGGGSLRPAPSRASVLASPFSRPPLWRVGFPGCAAVSKDTTAKQPIRIRAARRASCLGRAAAAACPTAGAGRVGRRQPGPLRGGAARERRVGTRARSGGGGGGGPSAGSANSARAGFARRDAGASAARSRRGRSVGSRRRRTWRGRRRRLLASSRDGPSTEARRGGGLSACRGEISLGRSGGGGTTASARGGAAPRRTARRARRRRHRRRGARRRPRGRRPRTEVGAAAAGARPARSRLRARLAASARFCAPERRAARRRRGERRGATLARERRRVAPPAARRARDDVRAPAGARAAGRGAGSRALELHGQERESPASAISRFWVLPKSILGGKRFKISRI